MSNDTKLDKFLQQIALLLWKGYVAIYWRRNKVVQSKLDETTGRNLGYYLYQSELFADKVKK